MPAKSSKKFTKAPPTRSASDGVVAEASKRPQNQRAVISNHSLSTVKLTAESGLVAKRKEVVNTK
eukprot:1330284-Amorphochlora_amoeboformis.AAC.1